MFHISNPAQFPFKQYSYVFFQSLRFKLLRRLRWPVPAERMEPARVDVQCEPGGDPVWLQRAAQWEGPGVGAAVRLSDLVRLRPARLFARLWHAVPRRPAVLRHRLGKCQG